MSLNNLNFNEFQLISQELSTFLLMICPQNTSFPWGDLRLSGCEHVHGATTTTVVRNPDANSENRINTNPQTSSTEGRAPITSTYWPALKKTLMEDPSARDCLDLKCSICWDRITVHDDEHTIENLPEYGNTAHEACVMPCGHILGFSCMRRMILDDRERGKFSQCPCCRFSLHHQICADDVAHKVTDWDNLDGVPLTIPEGGEVKGRCFSCLLSNMALELSDFARRYFMKLGHPSLEVGVFIRTCCSARIVNIHYWRNGGVPFDIFPFHTNIWRNRLDQKLNHVIAAHQKSWVNVPLESVRVDLVLFRPALLPDQSNCEAYMPPFAQEDQRG